MRKRVCSLGGLSAFSVVTLLAALVLVAQPGATQANMHQNATASHRWRGQLGVTTNAEGLWTLVTINAQKPGQPLQAAFVLQQLPPVPPAVNLAAEGSIEVLSRPPEAPQLAITVTTRNGTCTFYKLEDYNGQTPSHCTVVNLAGIARYERTPEQDTLPSTHDDFVRQVLPSLEKEGPHLNPGGKTLDDCTACVNGGPGATSCSSAPPPASPTARNDALVKETSVLQTEVKQVSKKNLDCSVTCSGRYYACCNLNCICCAPSP